MLHNRKKLAKIVEELSTFFFSIESKNIKSSINIADSVGTITFEADYAPKYAYKFETMSRLLNAPKDETMEDEYWQLTGSGEPEETSQLLLIGVMIDNIDIDIESSSVRIIIKKKLS